MFAPMHTLKVVRKDGEAVASIQHNSDWSGETIINMSDGQEIEIPEEVAGALLQAGAERAMKRVASVLFTAAGVEF